MSKMQSWRSPVFPVADVVPGDRAVTEDSLRVVPRHLKAGGGQGGDADVARGTAGSLAVRHKLLVEMAQPLRLLKHLLLYNSFPINQKPFHLEQVWAGLQYEHALCIVVT